MRERRARPNATGAMSEVLVGESLQIPLWAWLVFGVVVTCCLVLDLAMHRGGHETSRKAAIGWSIGWICVALAFNGFLAVTFGGQVGQEFISAWLLEKSLSVDNLVVFIVIFEKLKVPQKEQHRVLFWGIIGALVTRAIFIAAGAALLSRFHWIIYVFGAFLIYTAYKMLRRDSDDEGTAKVLRFVEKRVPFTPELHGHDFMVKLDGVWKATPLFLALLVVELSDVVFAVDSIPAVFSVTERPFIVYTSNVFAILGLRALYLVIADLLKNLEYLHYGLAGVLTFAGAKMLLSHVINIPPLVSLAVIVVVITASVVASVMHERRRGAP